MWHAATSGLPSLDQCIIKSQANSSGSQDGASAHVLELIWDGGTQVKEASQCHLNYPVHDEHQWGCPCVNLLSLFYFALDPALG